MKATQPNVREFVQAVCLDWDGIVCPRCGSARSWSVTDSRRKYRCHHCGCTRTPEQLIVPKHMGLATQAIVRTVWALQRVLRRIEAPTPHPTEMWAAWGSVYDALMEPLVERVKSDRRALSTP